MTGVLDRHRCTAGETALGAGNLKPEADVERCVCAGVG